MPIPRRLLFLPLILAFAQASAQEAPERLTKETATRWLGNGSATEVPGTRSPDKKIALWWATDGQDTGSVTLVWAPADKSRCLNIPDIWKHAPDQKDLTVLWKPDSSLVAFHDATTKHSRLQLLAFAKDAATAVPTPDLAAELAKGIPAGDELASSGAVPVRWDAAGRLEVRLRGKTRSGKSPAKTVFIEVKEGRASLAK